jgi:hypothetical protein
MAVRVDPVPGDAGWYSDQPPQQGRRGKGKIPAAPEIEPEEPTPEGDDYYTPSEAEEEG